MGAKVVKKWQKIVLRPTFNLFFVTFCQEKKDYYEKNGFVLLLFCSGYFNFLLISFDCCIIICPMLSRIAASCSIW